VFLQASRGPSSSGIGECVVSMPVMSNIDPFLDAPSDGALLLLTPVPAPETHDYVTKKSQISCTPGIQKYLTMRLKIHAVQFVHK